MARPRNKEATLLGRVAGTASQPRWGSSTPRNSSTVGSFQTLQLEYFGGDVKVLDWKSLSQWQQKTTSSLCLTRQR